MPQKQEIQTRNESVTVDTSSIRICQDIYTYGQRQALVITNTSTGGQSVTLSWGQEAVAGAGIILISAGATHNEAIDSGFLPTNSYINAVASAAGATIAIHERIVANYYG